MAHYTVDYSNLSRTDADARAIQDTRSYCGKKYFNKVLTTIRAVFENNPDEPIKVKLKTLRIALSICAGINGYPVRPLIRYALTGNASPVPSIRPLETVKH